jgi:phosphoribosylformylglycinamidine synthase
MPTGAETINGKYIGPRREMITPWSTNAVEISQNMGVAGITRIEEYYRAEGDNPEHDPMLQRVYHSLDQEIFTVHHEPEPLREIEDIAAYNDSEGLALSPEEISYLENLSRTLGRKLTDSEVLRVFPRSTRSIAGTRFSTAPSLLMAGAGIITLRSIKKTTRENPNHVVSAIP